MYTKANLRHEANQSSTSNRKRIKIQNQNNAQGNISGKTT